MTPKNVMQADFKEIPAIELTCTECSGVQVIPLPKDSLPKKLVCPGCNRPLWSDENDSNYQKATGITEYLSKWKRSDDKGNFRIGFSLPYSSVLSTGKLV